MTEFGDSQSRGGGVVGGGGRSQSGRIKKRAAHSENFLGGLVCSGNLAFRLQ